MRLPGIFTTESSHWQSFPLMHDNASAYNDAVDKGLDGINEVILNLAGSGGEPAERRRQQQRFRKEET